MDAACLEESFFTMKNMKVWGDFEMMRLLTSILFFVSVQWLGAVEARKPNFIIVYTDNLGVRRYRAIWI